MKEAKEGDFISIFLLFGWGNRGRLLGGSGFELSPKICYRDNRIRQQRGLWDDEGWRGGTWDSLVMKSIYKKKDGSSDKLDKGRVLNICSLLIWR